MSRVPMFIGHFALSLAAKRATPRVSLAVLCAAAQMADLLWPILVAVGVEQVRIDPGNTAVTPLDFVSYPYSHSLLLLVLWGIVLAMAYNGFQNLVGADPRVPPPPAASTAGCGEGVSTNRRTFIVIAALVVSHWVLDWITHRPDMPLYPGGPRLGLGLWNSVGATLAIELAMYAAGLWVYMRATRPRDGQGRWGFWTLAAFLMIVYIGNILSPPPPSVGAVWVSAVVGGVILLVWIWWVDRHRDVILASD